MAGSMLVSFELVLPPFAGVELALPIVNLAVGSRRSKIQALRPAGGGAGRSAREQESGVEEKHPVEEEYCEEADEDSEGRNKDRGGGVGSRQGIPKPIR